MIAVLSMIYASFYFLFFKKLKMFAVTVKNISIFTGVGIVMIGSVVFAWWTFAPTTIDGRMVQYVIPIVPNVKGVVIDVPIKEAQVLKKGDVLYKIDPTPYQFTVDQLKASVDQAEANKTLAEIEVKRTTGLVRASAGAQAKLDKWNAKLGAAHATIASLAAQLGKAQWQLEETVVRAPYEGYAFNLQLRPGNFVTTIPAGSSLSFVSNEAHAVVASFSQSAIRYVNIGDPVEMVFAAHPGRVYSGKITEIVPGSGTSQMSASGKMLVMSGAPENSRWPVRVDLDNPEEAAEIPQSSSVSMMAVYTKKGKPVHVISKVVMRMSAWTGYLTSP